MHVAILWGLFDSDLRRLCCAEDFHIFDWNIYLKKELGIFNMISSMVKLPHIFWFWSKGKPVLASKVWPTDNNVMSFSTRKSEMTLDIVCVSCISDGGLIIKIIRLTWKNSFSDISTRMLFLIRSNYGMVGWSKSFLVLSKCGIIT